MEKLLVFLVLFHATNPAPIGDSVNPQLSILNPLASNYTRNTGERIRLTCDFKLTPATIIYNQNDFTIYWVKNYQELLQTKKGHTNVIRKNLSTVLILRNIETFDSGSYMCIAELSLNSGTLLLNASSETTLFVKQPEFQRQENNIENLDMNDYLLDFDSNDAVDEFPELNPTIVENFDDKGFCEPYRGTICAGIITSNYSIYSTSSQQQDMIEERLRSIMPFLSDKNKNNLSERCSTFAIPSLCLFAFPLCDKTTHQPRQICRPDCHQLQGDICKNEFVNVKSIFTKSSNSLEVTSSNSNNNFLLDCNQLPPSSDSPKHCLPIVSMTLDALKSQMNEKLNPFIPDTKSVEKVPSSVTETCFTGTGISYLGTQSHTRRGFTCQRWDTQFPHTHRFGSVPELAGHNFCRNMDNSEEPWCYTTNPEFPRDFCAVPKCTLLDSAFKNLPNLMAIIIPSSVILFLIVMLIILYFRCCRHPQLNGDESLKTSINSGNHNYPSVAVLGPNGQANTHLQHNTNNRLRMSSVSINKKKNSSINQFRNGSSKSSVASSAIQKNNQIINEQLNPFIHKNINYENDNHFQTQNHQIYQFHAAQTQQPVDCCVKKFSPQNIRLLQEIGKGRFGSVYTGELIGSFGPAPNSVVKVTIKTLKNQTNASQFQVNSIPTSTPMVPSRADKQDTDAASHFNEQEFYNEISLYSSIHNRHLANLIGIYATNYQKNYQQEGDDDESNEHLNHPQCMIFEHLNNGDLHEYLLQRGRSSQNSAAIYNGMMGSQSNLSAVSSSIGGVSSNYLNLQQQQRNVADFLYIGQQIASGMEYLSSQNFILKDLATRNILMADNLTVKISIDLIAQYKEQYSKDYYKFQMKMLPVRWMPTESLLYGRYTQQSDVWSFGVCLWEIFNYGCQPYSGCTNPEAIEMIRDRQLLSIPEDCPQRAYALMLECWHELPMQRPTFTDIVNRLRNWENYYLFNNQPACQLQQIPLMQHPPPLPLPIHLQQQQVPHFGMTASYSSNSQNSKASSLLGNTASTGVSASGSPPPLPPPMQMNQQQCFMSNLNCNSPSKVNTNLFLSKFNAQGNTNSLRMSHRNFNQCNVATFGSGNNTNIPNSGQIDINYEL